MFRPRNSLRSFLFTFRGSLPNLSRAINRKFRSEKVVYSGYMNAQVNRQDFSNVNA